MATELTPRIRVIGREDFSAREWLRRELIWAYLMTPYSVQARMWLDGAARAQHNGNVTRQKVYEQDPGVEAQSLAFFNHGKNIAGIISSAILFRASLDKSNEGAHIDILAEQASAIDRLVGRQPKDFTGEELTEDASYEETARLAGEIGEEADLYSNNLRRLRASNIMSALACREVEAWIAASMQNEAGSLPTLTIQDGGHPRSAGERVDRLQPVFYTIVQSSRFQELSET